MKRIGGHNIALAAMVAGVTLLVLTVCYIGILLSGGEHALENDSLSASSNTYPSEYTSIEAAASGPTQAQYINIKNQSDEPDGFDAEFYAKRLYELKYLFAVDRFETISELSVSAVVQFAFCHLYYDSLVDMPKEKTMLFRQVLPESIAREIENLFGENNIDIKKSDLYNADKKVFEMWQPQYSTSVYADVDYIKKGDNIHEVTAKFYKSKDKSKTGSTVRGIFERQHDKFILTSMLTT